MQHEAMKQQAPSSKEVHLSGIALSVGEKNNLSENSTWTVRTPVRDLLFWEEIHLSYQILSGTLRL